MFPDEVKLPYKWQRAGNVVEAAKCHGSPASRTELIISSATGNIGCWWVTANSLFKSEFNQTKKKEEEIKKSTSSFITAEYKDTKAGPIASIQNDHPNSRTSQRRSCGVFCNYTAIQFLPGLSIDSCTYLAYIFEMLPQ